MDQGRIALGDRAKKILELVRSRYGLADHSDAVNFVISRFGEEFLERELQPEYAERLRSLLGSSGEIFESADDLRGQLENGED